MMQRNSTAFEIIAQKHLKQKKGMLIFYLERQQPTRIQLTYAKHNHREKYFTQCCVRRPGILNYTYCQLMLLKYFPILKEEEKQTNTKQITTTKHRSNFTTKTEQLMLLFNSLKDLEISEKFLLNFPKVKTHLLCLLCQAVLTFLLSSETPELY